ncbi:trypsin [Bombina bombina]|uniref:trypsin n=1 Tax=Bombina bombina TaxID=8345 RepID=UPI00235A86F4|nr:trypsin [Bombina bombina]
MYLTILVALLESAVWVRGAERIIGGVECVPHSQPWQAALYFFDSYTCGGVLINENWVLSAAHCCTANIQIRMGMHNRVEPDEAVQFNFAEKAFIHPSYNAATYESDIMLIRLWSPFNMTEYVQTAGLPDNPVAEGTGCTISGWGSTTSPADTHPDVLQCASVSVVSHSHCQECYPNDNITDNMLCAGVAEGGIDTCQGDSGGPFICNSVLQGITSWGEIPCALPDKPGIYTKLINFIPWINCIMANPDICDVGSNLCTRCPCNPI